MSDNKLDVGQPDRGRVSESDDYDVRHVAETHGIGMDVARALIARDGNGRDLDAAAESLKRR